MNIAVLTRVCTLIILVLVVIVGGLLCLLRPADITFPEYLRDVSLAVGLLAVGHGLDKNSTP